MAQRDPQFNQHVLVDTTPMPDHIPKVEEVGATSAYLTSAAYFIGDRCKAFNDDFMKCKDEGKGRGEIECLKEGRKVTRCAASVIKDINTHCLDQFKAHADCLENNNHYLFECRKAEMSLNTCIFDKLGLKKTIPGAPENQVPVHLRPKQKYAQYPGPQY
ncbi:NADH-ubiquinone oxidoreductase 20.8 kDa subunit [Penicillium canariense]|uniref:NADH-ubiquinone oxidoreductase n=1 Tax=Penicillium canariense TaxID=189055 RepID=A0A9W9I2U3_9EURO|nr:NADH-ubiquinone oxidoreductase 20.8 kDa subunit [Penicillium canariense]KAJ5166875.1 NADH-ubiquinone oxidoreductase 20.8 kDa subunit [Penicillium canariense]